jgi:hypothetical protein
MESTETLCGLSSRGGRRTAAVPAATWSRAPGVTTATASPLCALPRQAPTTPPQRRAGQVRRHRPGSGIFRREPRCPRTYLTPVTGVRPSRGTHLRRSGRMTARSWAMLCVPVLSSLAGTLAHAPVGCQHVPGRVLWDALPSRTSRWTRPRPGSASLSQPYSLVVPFGRVRGRSVNCCAAPCGLDERPVRLL